MILYNQDRKLIAIDNELVDFLGFGSLDELKNSVNDIAELFEKKPGYIYNFKNFSWISYILSNPSKEHKAIINLQENSIEVKISIHILTSWDSDSARYFLINLSPIEATLSDNILYQNYFEETPTIKEENIETEQSKESLEEINLRKPKKEEKVNIDFENLLKENESEKNEIEKESALTIPEPKEEKININFDELLKNYPSEELKEPEENISYDYKKVSEELEVDEKFIKELVKEFIEQSEKLKDQIQKALEENNIEKIHSLLHKIKGAASNLRIEQAINILNNTRGENDLNKLKEISKEFYDFLEKFKKYILGQKIEKNEHIKENLIENREIQEEKRDYEKELFAPYNIEIVKKDLGLSKDVILGFINDYIQDSKKQKDRLNELIEKKNIEELKNIIHKLKGSAANLHIEKIVEILNYIRNKIDKNNFNDIKKDIDNFFKYLSYLENELNNLKNNEFKKELKKSSAQLGLNINSYNKFVKEYLNELKTLLQEDEKKIKKDTIKYKSMAENLRLEKIAKILNKISKEKDIKTSISELAKTADDIAKEIS